MDRVIMSRASEWVFESLKGWHRRGSDNVSLVAEILDRRSEHECSMMRIHAGLFGSSMCSVVTKGRL